MNAALAGQHGSDLEAAETKAVEARRVADAYAEQVQRRRAKWEALTAAAATAEGSALERAWTDYQHAIAQYRSASQTARAAESIWTNVLLDSGRANVLKAGRG